MRCDQCKWWIRAFTDGTGLCRRFPHEEEKGFASWCGEFRSQTKPLQDDELRKALAGILKKLSYREREIIKLRYGLGDGLVYTLEEVAHIFKVTRERIRNIEKKAIGKLSNDPDMERLAP